MADLILKSAGKSFPGVDALTGIDLVFKSGTIHAVVGANGAGKSTLLKILSGVYDVYNGTVYYDDKSIKLQHPCDAKRNGIHTVYQEVDQNLIGYFTVAENILLDTLGAERTPWINWDAMRAKARKQLAVLDQSGEIPVTAPVNTLSLHAKQIILIARALVHDVRFLLLDEPTAPLSRNETGALYRIIRGLAKAGVGIVFISHRLSEVFELCDTISILKDGKLVATKNTCSVCETEVIEMMLGGKYNPYKHERSSVNGTELLRAENICVNEKLSDITFAVAKGEILGFAGMTGAGKSELARALFGADMIHHGTLFIKNNRVKNSTPAKALKSGIALVPEERRRDGLLLNESIRLNCMLAQRMLYSLFGIIRKHAEEKCTAKSIHDLSISTPSMYAHTERLSGGNQQKVVISRWLQSNAEIFIFDEPTKGVDIGAKQEIFRIISDLARQGKAILYFSCEVEELLSLSHRLCIMHDGKILKTVRADSVTSEDVYTIITGCS